MKLVFDLDGTLVDPKIRDYLVYYDTMISLGQATIPLDPYWELRREATPIIDIISQTVENPGSIISHFLTIRGLRSELPKYFKYDNILPHVHEILGCCSEHFECHLVTSRSSTTETLNQLDLFGLSKYFKNVAVLNGHKYEYFESLTSVAAVIGDTENDIKPAQEIGTLAIALTTGIRSRSFLEQLSPDYIFDDIFQIFDVLL